MNAEIQSLHSLETAHLSVSRSWSLVSSLVTPPGDGKKEIGDRMRGEKGGLGA